MENAKKKHGIIVIIAVLLLSLVQIETSLVNSALSDIMKAFPGVEPTLVSLISTMPILIMIPMTILSGKMCYYYSKRNIVILGLTLYVIGGVGGAFVNATIYQIIGMRCILGLGAGLVAPLGNAIIADVFEETDRAKMIGWSNSFGSAVAFIMTWIGGALCVINWKYTFLAYLVFGGILILEVFALPKMEPERNYKVEESKNGEQPKIGFSVVVLAGGVLLSLLFGMILMLKLSMYIADNGIGNALTTATAFNFYSLGAIVMGMVFMSIYKTAKRFTPAIGLICMGLTFIIVMNSHSAIGIYLAMFVNGVGGGIFMPYIFTKATMVGGKAQTSFCIGLVMQGLFLGQFLGSFVEPALRALFGNASIKFLYTFGAGAFIVMATISILWAIFKQEKKTVDVNENTLIG